MLWCWDVGCRGGAPDMPRKKSHGANPFLKMRCACVLPSILRLQISGLEERLRQLSSCLPPQGISLATSYRDLQARGVRNSGGPGQGAAVVQVPRVIPQLTRVPVASAPTASAAPQGQGGAGGSSSGAAPKSASPEVVVLDD